MARYIDADKLTDKLEELQFNAPVMTPVMKIYNVIELIEDAPTADVVKLKHGYWIWTEGGKEDYEQYWICSVCGEKSYIETKFCSDCGAKMDGGKAE